MPYICIGHQYAFLHSDYRFPPEDKVELRGLKIVTRLTCPRASKLQETVINRRLSFHQLDDKLFLDYMAGCKGYATTAGFESVCEAAYLSKPVLMVPAHIEQACNAHEFAQAGFGIAAADFDLDALLAFTPKYQRNVQFRVWVEQMEEMWMKALETLQ